ncbi:restriction endonuclease [Anabaena cylindrica UHCC 0172]|uniref:WD40 domain-containing protein n=1 Tax=Anabaena cylindrica TaxID=1165 RepID=UPI002B213F58|nr:restriction endonuclease [Anabaena cylindrica]MEA5550120.1 restriction endonuclease [Anabaena cylindrica UHCC 0172]
MQELVSVRTFKGHSNKVLSVVFSPDGKILASASDDKTVKIWNLVTKESYTLEGHGESSWFGGVNSVAFSPDGKILASASDDKTIKLWDVNTKQEIETFTGHEEKVYCVAFSPDGKILASASKDKTIKFWSIPLGKEISSFKGHLDDVLCVAFSPNGKILASGGGGNDKTIKIWYLAEKKVQTLTGHSDWFARINSLAFSPDGNILASGSKDKTVKLWKLETGKEIYTLTGHSDDVCSVAFSPNGQILASSSKDKTVKLWNLNNRQAISTFTGLDGSVYSVVFSPNGETLAAGCEDKNITLFPCGNLQKVDLTSTKKERAKFSTYDISCPWTQLDDEQFEELCYDLIKEKHNPIEIHKIGKSRSRDGGRDIVFYKSIGINNNPVKWIVQCKLIRNGKSLTGKKVDNIRDMLDEYNAGGFCVMTSGIIDATLHDKLDNMKEKTAIEIEKWSYLEIERFLAEHPEIKARYFKD